MTELTPEACRAARAILKWSVSELAERAGVDSSTINLIENDNSIPTEIAEKIVAIFGDHNVEIISIGGTGAKFVMQESVKEQPFPADYSVTVIDNFNRMDPTSRFEVKGFQSADEAKTYGMRRARSSVEQCRKEHQTRDQHYRMWMAMGEEVAFEGIRFGSVYFDEFHENPITGNEGDYISLQPPPQT